MISSHGAKTSIRFAVYIILLLIIQRLLTICVSYMRSVVRNKMQPLIEYELVKKISSMSYASFESEEIQNLLKRICEGSEEHLLQILINRLDIICFFLSNLSIIIVFLKEAGVLSILVLFILVFSCYNAVRNGKKQYQASMEVTSRKRRAAYYETILGNRDTAAERMLFGFQKTINNNFCTESHNAREREKKAQFQWFLATNLNSYLSIGITIAVMFALVKPVLQCNTSVGLFVSLITAFITMSQNVTQEFSDMVRKSATLRALIQDFTTLSKIPNELHDLDFTLPNDTQDFLELEFKNVSFTYQGSERQILDSVSFRIEKGYHYAFVGKNGSGKTTIIKLILGLYQPSSGEILLNGKNIEQYTKAQRWRMIGVLFQDFAKYPISFRDNIALGRTYEMEAQREILDVSQTIQLDEILEKLPEGIDTKLGKITDKSVDLSGGEWQRVAMARIYYNRATLKILDEPTAALDPIQEQYVFKQFQKIHDNVTTILITHRLGATITCDHIFVLDNGKIIQEGKHSALVNTSGVYKSMYESQRAWYL